MNTKRILLPRTVLGPVAALTTLLLTPTLAEAANTLTLRGGEKEQMRMCGQTRAATVVDQSKRMVAQVRTDGRKPRRSAALRIDRCDDGRWVKADDLARGRILSKARIATREHADLRVRSRGRTQFARVGDGAVMRVPVSFRVVNVNNVPVPCPVDGRTYTVKGHITAPAGALEPGGQKSATLYNHGHSFDETIWTYGGMEGFDFTGELAKRGHTSVSYDRIGYEKSDKLDGNRSCYASEADTTHQIIDKLKAGDYTLEGRSALKFGRVALAGIHQSALINEGVASTFKNQDALLHFGFAPAAFATPSILTKFVAGIHDCGIDPSTANQQEGNPSGYSFRGRTDADFRETNFVSAPEKIRADFTARRNVDPCGLPLFVGPFITYAAGNDHQVRGPVLIVNGAEDPNFFPMNLATTAQRALFSGSGDITSELMPGTGHALPLEESAPRLQSLVSNWLERRGF